MANEKIKELNQIKDDLYNLYPNAVKVTVVVEAEKITVTPVEKYEINTILNDANEDEE
ncbi:hypothetical protein GCM10023310_70920 [Paenibacillus vulneris]|uniref:Phage protein n=1 Tax=Paenibacillus vulneris TaxID=1133364 RepID=A0ABW3UIX1_9BACL